MAAIAVTILVPAHNEGPTIVSSLRALLANRYPALQVTVINDGSVDDTLEMLRAESRNLGREVRIEEQLHAAGATTVSSRSCAAAAAYSRAARTSSRSKRRYAGPTFVKSG